MVIVLERDQTNYTEKFRGIFSVGKHRNTVGCVGIIFLPILFREKICFTVCFMVNEALVAPQSAEILHPFDLDIARVIDCKL
jgi:hypothetical protein